MKKINKNGKFGGWAINKVCFNYIRKILPEGKTILELGSGYGTEELSKYYKIYSIENDEKWVGKFNSNYIHAPIQYYNLFNKPMFFYGQKGWYDPNILKYKLPKIYDLILVDGPNSRRFGRAGFYKYLDLFNTNVPIIIDDVNRAKERWLIKRLSVKLKRGYKILEDGETGVIYL